jgi:hypothetical protein
LDQLLRQLTNPELTSKKTLLIVFFVTLTFNAVVLTYFHNRFWWPPDEGVYAHIADRVARGEVLNYDVEEVHTGYLNLFHSVVFRVFGTRLVSLRYPLAAVSLLESCLIFLILARRGVWAAAAGSIGATSLGVIQYLNPTPNWYCLFLATLIVVCLSFISPDRRWRLVLIGFLTGLIFLLRQITGVFVAIAVLTYFLTEHTDEASGRETVLSKALLALMWLGSLTYLTTSTELGGLVLFGIWPLAILALAFFYSRTSNKKTVEIVIRLALGCVLAAVPILVYHMVHGSLWTFYDDTVLRALTVSQFSYLKFHRYWEQQVLAVQNIREFGSVRTVANGIYWVILPLLALIVGIVTTRAFHRQRTWSNIGSLPLIAVFYAQVALLQQIPIYLFYSLPLTFAALIWLFARTNPRRMAVLTVFTVFLVIVSIRYQAAQPIGRTLGGIIRGDRTELVPATTLPRTGLWIDPESLRIYTEVVNTIREQTQAQDTIFVLPNDPEFYFLSERKNPFRLWNTAIGVRDENEAALVMNVLKNRPPKIVVIDPHDRNNTSYSNAMIAYVRGTYRLIKTVGNFEIYVAP